MVWRCLRRWRRFGEERKIIVLVISQYENKNRHFKAAILLMESYSSFLVSFMSTNSLFLLEIVDNYTVG